MALKKLGKTNMIVLISAVILVLLLIVAGIISNFMKRIPKNPQGTIGNTAGNLNNGGLFCESGNSVYFSNPYDNGYIYVMSPDGSGAKLFMDVPAKYINAAGDYIYFNQVDSDIGTIFGLAGNMHGIYRKKTTGKKEIKCLDRAVCGFVVLSDDTVYYQYADDNETSLRYVSTDGKEKGLIVKEYINPSCVISGNIFYPDRNSNHLLAMLDTRTMQSSIYLNERVHDPVYSNGYIYYMSVDDDYHLYRYSISDNTATRLTDERLDLFNVYGDVIFYQVSDQNNPMLVRMRADGSEKTAIAEGIFTNINMTAYYTYFQDFLDPTSLYRVPTTGGSMPELFMP
ncbi:MAG: DUF5050 domain-containing protein [Lachnospiraceae bacterium]|nr:DUF5050 domain-containing protein [Lachnospiraceae bacterium]